MTDTPVTVPAMHIEWKFPHCMIKPKLNGFTDVITEVNWRLKASDDDGHEAVVFGRVRLPEPAAGAEYKDKTDITEDELIEWVKPLMGYDGYMTNLQNHLESQRASDERERAESLVFKKSS